jgi:erythromycin esterase-like protein
MINQAYEKVVHAIDDAAQGLAKQHNDYTNLLDKIGDARFVLIGEATHGTQEFYQARIEITQALIEKKNFMAVAIEGDWPDVYRIHRYLQGQGQPAQWQTALEAFKRFPTWMWRNTTLPPFLQWLRTYNDNLPSSAHKVGFYGLDLYSLDTSMTAVIDYLSTVDSKAAEHARQLYACFDRAKLDPQSYGYLASLGTKKSCIQESVEQFLQIQHHAIDYVKHNGAAEED